MNNLYILNACLLRNQPDDFLIHFQLVKLWPEGNAFQGYSESEKVDLEFDLRQNELS